MQYTKRTDIRELKEKYKYLVGWGAGRDEFYKRYNPFLYSLDYMIDTKESLQGSVVCGIRISGPDILKSFNNEKVCIILYPNAEWEILDGLKQYLTECDTIVSRLIDCGGDIRIHSYSTSSEDVYLLHALHKLGIQNPFYVDIGVCHPVIRNNTYLFYEQGYTNGLLIEPNRSMCELAKIYRPQNRIIEVGACAGEDSRLRYYMHPDSSCKGYNTFDYKAAQEGGFEKNYQEIKVININQIFKENCKTAPDIIDIDTEGMDYELLEALDLEKYRTKLICAETCERESTFCSMMDKKGYIHYMSTTENSLFIAKELLSVIKE